jgi:hypothetical protein
MRQGYWSIFRSSCRTRQGGFGETATDGPASHPCHLQQNKQKTF